MSAPRQDVTQRLYRIHNPPPRDPRRKARDGVLLCFALPRHDLAGCRPARSSCSSWALLLLYLEVCGLQTYIANIDLAKHQPRCIWMYLVQRSGQARPDLAARDGGRRIDTTWQSDTIVVVARMPTVAPADLVRRYTRQMDFFLAGWRLCWLLWPVASARSRTCVCGSEAYHRVSATTKTA